MKQKILSHLIQGKRLTHLTAYKLFGSLGSFTKIMSRIRQELNDKGIELRDWWAVSSQGKRYKMYGISYRDRLKLK